MRTTIGVILAVSLFGWPATSAAQTDYGVEPFATGRQVAPLAMLSLLQTLSKRVDRLQARMDAADPAHAHAWVDGVQQPQPTNDPTLVFVLGWGFACNQDADVVVVVDDIEVPNVPGRNYRQDVRTAWQSPWCSVEEMPGVSALIDMAPFEPGMQGDHVHTFKIRVYDHQGRMAESQVWTAQIAVPDAATAANRRRR